MQRKSSLPTVSVSPSRTPNVLTRTTSSSTTSSPQSSAPSTAHQINFPSHPPVLGKVGTTGDPVLAKRRARNLLRDYYGLGNATEAANPSGPEEPGLAHVSGSTNDSARLSHPQERLSIDSPYFDVDAYFNKLVGTSSLNSLLSTANELMSEIRELDGERQSLVYNHHHELVEASETIDKMKSSSQKLDGTLSQLQDSLSVISQLSTSLTSTRAPSNLQSPSDPTATTSETALTNKFEDGLHLSALLSLPAVLKGLLATETRAAADQLWGQWEPALRSFEEAGVQGAKQVGNECREALRNAKSFTA
ncbi:hypothetical protein PGT21_004955 [Puccinia graminis f. sp. tritici]|uniref:Vacuolar protein sorting-associated protein 51 homolog n=1 Tax=Puccinia graminis f. sp. tritici TaxID=56615 RepID=A0A5B0NT79_PUCGR|nr:hypothetical protein PGT21_004955 [Puccinia graminis f. sp. tritici]KAA1093597.1 hypothetical protein PGTUg99_003474 [Puccinia graminis f. sp. tritici]